MPQVLVDPQHIQNDKFHISGSEAHHLIRVLRKNVNDEIELFDGAGHRYKGRLTTVDLAGLNASGDITETMPAPEKAVQIQLYQGLPKGSKFDFVLEKATELGVDAIVPFLSKKNIIQLTPEQGMKKVERWNRLIESAAKQSNRTTLPTLEPPAPLESYANRFQSGTTLLFDVNAKTSLKATLQEKGIKKLVNVVIGPESGFDSQELDWLEKQAVKSVSLGSRVLRTESAGLAVLSILNHEFDLF